MPLAFCNCSVCTAARRGRGKDIRRRSSVLVNDDLLIDLGPDTIVAAAEAGIDVPQIDYLLQTHAHSDHFDAGHLITRHRDYANQDIRQLRVLASEKTLAAMNLELQREADGINLWDPVDQEAMSLRLQILEHGQSITWGRYHIKGIESLHDTQQDALVYLITEAGKSFFYGADLLHLSARAWAELEGERLDILVLDQTYGAGHNAGGHLDAEQVQGVLRKMRETGIIDERTPAYATHLSHEGNGVHETANSLAVQRGYAIAYDGLCVEV